VKLGGSLRRNREGKGSTIWRRKGPDGKTYVDLDLGGSMDGRLRLGLQLLALAIAGWLVGYLISTRILYPAPPPPADLVEVPDVRGMPIDQVSERLSEVGLTLGAVDSLRHPTVAADLVLGQSPLPGQLASPGSEVWLTRSLGPEARDVPDVANVDWERARVVLEASGFVVASDSVDSDVPRGHVVSTDPPAESTVVLPAHIRVTVSRGPPLVPMPLVVGMAETDAIALLDSLGLVVDEIEEVFRFGRDQGIVIEQDPEAETLLERGTGVRLSIGRRGG
jgi:beta-lactam-binding protein with PASTA domain